VSDVLWCDEDVRFVDNGGIVDQVCINCLFITVSFDLFTLIVYNLLEDACLGTMFGK
jgi:hypothetical protein